MLGAEQKEVVGDLLQSAKAGKLVASMQKVYTYLDTNGLAWRLTIPTDQIGIHRLLSDIYARVDC